MAEGTHHQPRLIHTESLVFEVASEVLARHGATLTHAAAQAGTGRRPLDAWRAVVEVPCLQPIT